MQRRIFRAWAHRNPLEETAPRAGPAALYQVRKWGPARGAVNKIKNSSVKIRIKVKIYTEMLIRVRNFVHMYALGRFRLESAPEKGNTTIDFDF